MLRRGADETLARFLNFGANLMNFGLVLMHFGANLVNFAWTPVRI